MSKMYPAEIHGKDCNKIDLVEINRIKSKCGHIPQHGIKYIAGGNAVVLTTNSLEDLDDFWVRNDCAWHHSQSPNRVRAGWTVYVVPNGRLIATTPADRIFGVKFTALSCPERNPSDGLWTSEGK